MDALGIIESVSMGDDSDSSVVVAIHGNYSSNPAAKGEYGDGEVLLEIDGATIVLLLVFSLGGPIIAAMGHFMIISPLKARLELLGG